MQPALPKAKKGVVYIYALQHPETLETRYIGRTYDPHGRLGLHLRECGSELPCARWIRKLSGAGLIPLMVVVEVTTDELWESRERAWIAFYRAINRGLLNVADGGHTSEPLTPEARKRHAEAARKANSKRFEGFCDPSGTPVGVIINLQAFSRDRGLCASAMHYVYQGKQRSHKGWTNTRPEAQEALRLKPPKKPRNQSEESRRRLSEKMMGRPGPTKGMKHSPETLAKMRTAQGTPEARARKSQASKGRKMTEEAKAKISASRRAHVTSRSKNAGSCGD